MFVSGETKSIGKITSIPTTFMFTPRPSSEQKWVKNAHKWALGARKQAPEAPTLGLWALGALVAVQHCDVPQFYVFELRKCL